MKENKKFSIKNKKVFATVVGSVSVVAFIGLVAGILALSLSALHTHDWTDWTVKTKATCETVGVETRFCKDCKETGSRELPRLSSTGRHTGGTATCKTKATCTTCGEKYGNLASHSGGTATCTNKAVCSVCKAEYGTIVESNHVWKMQDEILPTCEFSGLKNREVCSEAGCDAVKNEGEIIIETGHAWKWDTVEKIDKCTTCQATASKNLEYQYDVMLGGYVVIGAGTNRDTNVIIPSKYNSKPVVGVFESAFGGYTNNINDRIKRVEFISAKTKVGSGAFLYCENLEKVVFAKEGAGKTIIDKGAFENCPSLSSVVFGSNETEIGYGAFKNCTKLSQLFLKEGLTKVGDAAFMGCEALTEFKMPETVTYLGVEAFKNCTKLKDVVINKNITALANSVFEGCKLLGKEFVLPDTVKSVGDKAFANCTSLEVIVFGQGAEAIGAQAFEGCSALTSVNFPEQLDVVGQDAFKDCNALKDVSVKDYKEWSEIVFANEYANPFSGGASLCVDGLKQTNIVIPETVTEIKAYAYYGYAMSELTIGKNVKNIASYAFAECGNLTKVLFLAENCGDCTSNVFYKAGQAAKAKAIKDKKEPTFTLAIGENVMRIPANLFNVERSDLYSMESIAATITKVSFEGESACKLIGAKAFENCVYLKEVRLPKTIRQISDRAFAECKALEIMLVPNGVTTFGKTIFANCANLETVQIPAKAIAHIEGRTKLENLMITGGNVEKTEFENCVSLKSLTLGEGVKRVGERAFYNCTGLQYVTILDSVEVIENYAFGNCTALKDLSQGDALKSIGDSAFSNCKKLENVAWSNSLVEILFRAFYECDGLTEIVLPASLKRIEKEAFFKCNKLARVDVQKSINWFVRTNAGDVYLSSTDLSVPETAASYLTDGDWYATCIWYCNQ